MSSTYSALRKSLHFATRAIFCLVIFDFCKKIPDVTDIYLCARLTDECVPDLTHVDLWLLYHCLHFVIISRHSSAIGGYFLLSTFPDSLKRLTILYTGWINYYIFSYLTIRFMLHFYHVHHTLSKIIWISWCSPWLTQHHKALRFESTASVPYLDVYAVYDLPCLCVHCVWDM